VWGRLVPVSGLGVRVVVVLLLLLRLVVLRQGEGNGGVGHERGVARMIRAGELVACHRRGGLGRQVLGCLYWFEFGLRWT
jgi:hypothetical protein